MNDTALAQKRATTRGPKPPAAPAPKRTPSEFEAADNFMAGKALAADLIEVSLAANRTGDRADLLAKYRGRNVSQDVFARDYLDAVHARPHLVEGFCAGLSAFLASAPTAALTPASVREASYLDCVGGPDTVYEGDEINVSGAQPPTQPPASLAPEPDWVTGMLRILGKLSELARAAGQIDPGGRSNTEVYASRLDLMAADMLEDHQNRLVGDDSLQTTDVSEWLFNIQAMVLSADAVCATEPQRAALHREILKAIDAAETMLDGDVTAADVEAIAASIPVSDDVEVAAQASQAAGIPRTLTRDTYLQDGGEIARDLLIHCTYEIEQLSLAVVRVADECEQGPERYEQRAAAIRIHELNSHLMSYIGGDDTVTLHDAAVRLFRVEHLDDLLAQQGRAVAA